MRPLHLCLALLVALFVSTLAISPASAGTVPACTIDSPPANCDNLYALTIDVPVSHGAYVFVPNPGCMNDSAAALHNVVQAAVVAGVPEIAMFSGPISDLATPLVAGELAKHGGFISEHLSPYAKNGALCAPVAAVVPTSATVRGYRLAAGDQTGWAQCQPGTDCGIGWCKFQGEPTVDKSAGMQAVIAMFMNWSHDRNRTARMTIFYEMPPGETPLTQM